MKDLIFVNGNPAKCGCEIKVSSGHGVYSDSVTIKLCKYHQVPIADEIKNKELSGGGEWH